MSDETITKEMIIKLVDDFNINDSRKDEIKNSIRQSTMEETVKEILPLLETEITKLDLEEKVVEENYQKEQESVKKKIEILREKESKDFNEEYARENKSIDAQIDALEELEKEIDNKTDDLIAQVQRKIDAVTADNRENVDNLQIENIRKGLR